MFDRKRIKEMRIKLQKKVDEFAKEEKVQAKVGNISFTNASFNAKIEVIDAKNDSDAERLMFESNCPPFRSITKGHYGKEFSYLDKHFKLVGYNNKARKSPLIVLEICSGKKYKLPLASEIIEKITGGKKDGTI